MDDLSPKRDYSREELVELARQSPPAFSNITSIIKMMFENWNPFPDRAYAEKVGWPVNDDGTITTAIGRVPSRELCEVNDLKELVKKSDIHELEELYKR